MEKFILLKRRVHLGTVSEDMAKCQKNKIIVELNYFLKANLKSSDLNINKI